MPSGRPNDDGPTGLSAPTGIAIPIAPLQSIKGTILSG